jgi:hypothetical protein
MVYNFFMNTLNLVKLTFLAEFATDTSLPSYIGNSLRGVLGRSLISRNCIRDDANCEDCQRKSECVYAEVFKSQTQVAGLTSVPNPFVFDFDYPGREHYAKGDTLDFSITLFGSAFRWKAEIVSAVKDMFQGKLGSLHLIKADEEYACEWSDEGEIPRIDTLTVELMTPLVLLNSKKLVADIDFNLFTDSLFNRIAGVIDVYGDSEFVLPYSLMHRKPNIMTTADLHVVSIKQEKQPIVGLMGKLSFSGELTRYIPYVDLCAQLHIGKLTTRGCGKIELEI